MKEFLSKNGIQYIDRNIETDKEALNELLKLGYRTTPVTLIGDKAIAGYEPNQILAVLQQGTSLEVIDPSIISSLLLQAIEAVEGAIRQMPDKWLDWSVPERNRTMREFTYHIFSHVLMAMASQPSNHFLEPASSIISVYTSFQQIADYGKTIIDQYRDWMLKQDFNALPKSLSEGNSEAKRLDVATGAVIQHLRQLYCILDRLDITDKSRIQDSKWPAEYVLSILW
jgi:glutaredoxin 3